MTHSPGATERVQRPSTHFARPHDVLADRSLSDDQKRAALDTLEQDARQLADAASEGMSGGEPSNLGEVLGAQAKLVDPGKGHARAAAGRLGRAIQHYPLSALGLAVVAGIGIGVWVRR